MKAIKTYSFRIIDEVLWHVINGELDREFTKKELTSLVMQSIHPKDEHQKLQA